MSTKPFVASWLVDRSHSTLKSTPKGGLGFRIAERIGYWLGSLWLEPAGTMLATIPEVLVEEMVRKAPHGNLRQSAQGWTLRHRLGYLLAAVSWTPGYFARVPGTGCPATRKLRRTGDQLGADRYPRKVFCGWARIPKSRRRSHFLIRHDLRAFVNGASCGAPRQGSGDNSQFVSRAGH